LESAKTHEELFWLERAWIALNVADLIRLALNQMFDWDSVMAVGALYVWRSSLYSFNPHRVETDI
jgi:hypothetical protein